MPNDFPADPNPDYPIDETAAEPEVLISVHRDGSEQRRYKGAGTGRKFRMSFGGSAPITYEQCSAILTHFAGRQGTTLSFNWRHPERTTETHLCRYAEAPGFRLVGYNSYQGEVTLREVPA